MTDNEDFKPNQLGLDDDRAWIPGYEGFYCAGKDGRIWRVPSPAKRWHSYDLREMKHSPNNHGYLNITLKMGREKSRSYTVQTLMGMSWLGYDEAGLGRASKLVVDHINNDRADNRLANLQIMTRAENLRKRHWNGTRRRRGNQRPVMAIDAHTGDTSYYRSGKAASEALHGDGRWAPMICCALKGRIKKAYGRIWKYVSWDEYEKETGDILDI